MSKPLREETPPTWLNSTFIETALKESLKNDQLKIIESEMKMATAAGDNYASQMFRFNLTIQQTPERKEKLSIIVKVLPPGKIGEELIKLAAFDKEEEAFSKVLPAITTLLQKAYPGHQKLWADCYYCRSAPEHILVLEDLRINGFMLGSRLEGLDMEHTVLVLQSLAKLHAASLVLKKENPNALEIYEKTFWSPDNELSVQHMFTAPFGILSEEILNWTEFDLEKRRTLSKKFKKMEGAALATTYEVWKRDDSQMNVLLHGDSWVNNFMFKYDPAGKLTGINFVDFQMMNFNTPVLDLQYFIFTSVHPDLRFDQIDSFLKTYHEAFEDTLKRLNHRLEVPYGLEQLKKDFDAKYNWGFIVLCTIFPLFLLPTNEAVHPDEFFKSDKDSNFERAYRREDLKKILVRGFKFFDEKGVP